MIYKSSEEKKNPLSVFLAELSGFTLSRVPAFFFFFFLILFSIRASSSVSLLNWSSSSSGSRAELEEKCQL